MLSNVGFTIYGDGGLEDGMALLFSGFTYSQPQLSGDRYYRGECI